MFQLLQFLTFWVVLIGLNGILLVTSDDCQVDFKVGYPFLPGDRSSYEGYPGLVLNCLDSRLVINISNHFYQVRGIDYILKQLTILDLDILNGPNCPQPRKNVSLQSTPYFFYDGPSVTIFYNCTYDTQYVVQSLPCLDKYNDGVNLRSYALRDIDIPTGFNGYRTCLESVVVPFAFAYDFTFYAETGKLNYTKGIKQGFQLSWSTPSECQHCENSGGLCQYNSTRFLRCHCGYKDNMYGRTPKFANRFCPRLSKGQKVLIGLSTGVGVISLLILWVRFMKIISSFCSCCSCWRKKVESSTNVEVFLENYGCLGLQRYKYSDIKKMTNSFKDTLGKGGYGCVFKGQLRDGRLVAVKVLKESKGKGEDFVNEVATIGRTNHVNVVSLLGFCTEETKRALVYEFMPNGSLERFIYKDKKSNIMPSLGSEKLYQIALGIARGLEYLHRGCNTRILHFDIKPHNILLDEDFCPKISDFGMAKLCPTRDVSVVSMVGARGTIGYIAPEVCCRNFGGVSHKSDVYSYGMMVFEMIGGRKNINIKVENMSEIYFPQWVYNHLKPDFNKERSCEMFEEGTTKKMIVAALWCIQPHPTNRPSITKVVEMLEGNIEELEMPPNPFLYPPSQSSFLSS